MKRKYSMGFKNEHSFQKLKGLNLLSDSIDANLCTRASLRAKTISAFVICLFLFSVNTFSQEAQAKEKELRRSKTLLSEANQEMQNGKFVKAEADYRRAISLNPENNTGKYNLGTAYYGKEKNAQAQLRFTQAAAVATEKAGKHRAFHNLGNTFMNEKNYTAAVEAYKNALRNNPTDDETRYNLALAKDLLEKNPPKDGGGDDKKKDEKEKDNKQDQQNKPDQPKDQKEDENKGENEKPQKPKEGNEDEKPQQQKPVPGELSPQQIKSLLEAMNNEEQKVLEKINAQKQKGAKVKSSKDW